MIVVWDKSYEIGVEQIDRQHRELFARFDGLMVAIGAGEGANELQQLLGFLEEYALNHFREEEALMLSCHYPLLAFHREAHQAFRERLGKLVAMIGEKGESPQLVTQTGRMLLRWLTDHVCGMDRDIGTFLQAGRSVWSGNGTGIAAAGH